MAKSVIYTSTWASICGHSFRPEKTRSVPEGIALSGVGNAPVIGHFEPPDPEVPSWACIYHGLSPLSSANFGRVSDLCSGIPHRSLSESMQPNLDPRETYISAWMAFPGSNFDDGLPWLNSKTLTATPVSID